MAARGSFLFFIAVLFAGCAAVVDETPPAEVTNLSVQSENETISLEWRNPSDKDFSNVEIKLASADNSEEKTIALEYGVSSYKISGLYNNVAYTITISAVDTSGNHSSGISCNATLSNLGGPAEVQNFAVSYGEGEAVLTWINPRDSKFAGVSITVVKNAASRAAVDDSAKGSVTYDIPLDDDSEIQTYTVKNLVCGATYSFTVKTFDTDKKYSQGTTSVGFVPVETKGLEFQLAADGASYSVSGFTGDETRLQPVTPEEAAGSVDNQITVTVFSTYNGKPVTEIGTNAFRNCRRVSHVVLPATITHICANAFEGCSSLSSIVIPAKTKAIDDGAFWNCPKLSWMVIPKSVSFIGLGATLGDADLKTIFYTGTKEECAALASNIKSGNSNLTGTAALLFSKSAEIRYNYDGITPVEFSAPQPVKNLTVSPGLSHAILSWINPEDKDFAGVIVTASPSDGSLAEQYTVASRDCTSYVATGLENGTSYVFSVTAFDKVGNKSEKINSASVKCGLVEKTDSSGFNYHVIPDGRHCAIDGYSGDRTFVVVPGEIESFTVLAIEENAFASDAMQMVSLPVTLQEIGNDAFAKCANLMHVFYAGSESQWNIVDGASAVTQMIHYNFTYNVADTTPPEEVAALFVRRGDRKIGLQYEPPKDADFISVQVTVAEPVEKIIHSSCDRYAVLGLTNGRTYHITVKTCDVYGNVSKGVTIAAVPEEIPESGITASGLKYKLLTTQQNDLSGTSYVISGYDFSVSPIDKPISIVIPETIHGVPVEAVDSFENNAQLSSLSISKNVAHINTKLLASCSALASISVDAANRNYFTNAENTILYFRNFGIKNVALVLHCVSGAVDFTGTTIAEVGEYAFSGCNEVTSVILPGTVKKIGAEAFANCTALKTIVLSAGLQEIQDGAFENCTNLTTCFYTGTKNDWKKITVDAKKNSVLSKVQMVYEYNK